MFAGHQNHNPTLTVFVGIVRGYTRWRYEDVASLDLFLALLHSIAGFWTYQFYKSSFNIRAALPPNTPSAAALSFSNVVDMAL
jgi:hypothetical protein